MSCAYRTAMSDEDEEEDESFTCAVVYLGLHCPGGLHCMVFGLRHSKAASDTIRDMYSNDTAKQEEIYSVLIFEARLVDLV